MSEIAMNRDFGITVISEDKWGLKKNRKYTSKKKKQPIGILKILEYKTSLARYETRDASHSRAARWWLTSGLV